MKPMRIFAVVSVFLATSFTAPSSFADVRTWKHHADSSNTLDKGRHAWVTTRLEDSGRMDFTVKVKNKVALIGYCFRPAAVFLDEKNHIILEKRLPQMCVDGNVVPWGRSMRIERYRAKVPAALASNTRKVVMIVTPGSKDPIKMLKRHVKRVGPVVAAAPFLI